MDADPRAVTAADLPPLVDMLCRAFAGEPFVEWLAGQGAHARRNFARYFEAAFALTLRHQEVFTLEGGDAAALWVPPGKWARNPLQEAVAGLRILRATQLPRSGAVIRGLLSVQAEHPRVPHRYLMILGVEPARQGKGLGSRLLRSGLARCDQEGVGAYLETALERDVRFYAHHGFQVAGTMTVKGGGPTLWRMWRDPHG